MVKGIIVSSCVWLILQGGHRILLQVLGLPGQAWAIGPGGKWALALMGPAEKDLTWDSS